MNYWEMRKEASKLIPRKVELVNKDRHGMKEKGRKSNYKQYSIAEEKTQSIQRLLDTESMNSFAEVSLRAQSCPMPLNIDVWDGLQCPYKCRYCYADYFRHSLYTSFFDNGKTLGLRHCAEEHWKAELDKLIPLRGEKVTGENQVMNAIRLSLPMRIGIRFEDFTLSEKKHGVALKLLEYLADADYPTMINTKSDLLGDDKYLKALTDNKGKAAVHITMISSDDTFNKLMEPGAPSFKKRIASAKILTEAGVRVVARIEPWMIYLNDEKQQVDDYILAMKESGVEHLTLDSYSYSAYSKGLAENFYKVGMDFERMFLLSADSQWLSSLLFGKFIEYIRSYGLQASTFDQGNVSDNDDWICCSVGDYFPDAGFNWGSGVIAIRFIQSKDGASVRWREFEAFVIEKGGWLATDLRHQVHLLWNGEGDAAWPIYWGKGIVAVGHDEDGVIWRYDETDDHRVQSWNGGLL